MRLATRIAYALLSPGTAAAVRAELKLAQARILASLSARQRRARAAIPRSGLRIQLGCGNRYMDGWINIDIVADRVDLVHDLRRPLPFATGSARLIYSEHVLEHLAFEHAAALLRECRRVLENGGTLRLGVPDAGLYLARYAAGDTSFFEPLRHLGGAVEPLDTPMKVVNQMMRMGGAHLFAWDFETLQQQLRAAGFSNITRFAPGQASSAELCLDDPAHNFETLYVEAT